MGARPQFCCKLVIFRHPHTTMRCNNCKNHLFTLAATSGNGTFVLNELSHLWSKSLKTFPQKEQEYSGKQDKAIGQLMASIERLFKSPELKAFIESYQSQIALFSIRLKDTTQAENAAMQSMSTFLHPPRFAARSHVSTPVVQRIHI